MRQRQQRQRQHGLTTVEFSLIAAVTIVLLFAVIEFGRVFYSYAVLNEGMRRAARLAAVCPVTNAPSPAILNTATLEGMASLPNFDPATNVLVQYLDVNGNPLGDPTGNYGAINYVEVQVQNYSIQLMIPFFDLSIPTPSFAVTLPRESFGVAPTNYINCGGFGP